MRTPWHYVFGLLALWLMTLWAAICLWGGG